MKIKHLRYHDVFGMTNIGTKRTGLKCNIWSEHMGCQSDVSHRDTPRVKINIPGSSRLSFILLPTVHIDKNCEEEYNNLNKSDKVKIDEGKKFVQDNVDLFLLHFFDTDDKEFDDQDLADALRKRGLFHDK